jgi:hypothetical protein
MGVCPAVLVAVCAEELLLVAVASASLLPLWPICLFSAE